MYTFESRIRYSETDSEGRLALSSLLNYFQDASTFHSEDLGMGVGYMKQERQVWVLSAWQIVINRFPALGEHVEIGTKPYDFRGFLGSRNFWMKDGEGNYLAKANSLWSLLSMDTGRPIAAAEEMVQRYGMEEPLEMDYAPRKIAIPKEGQEQEAVVVRRQYLDTNHHVNNGQFIHIAMDYLPENFLVGQLRAEYRQQAFLNDVMVPRVSMQDGVYTVVLNDLHGKPYVIVEFTEAANAAECEEVC